MEHLVLATFPITNDCNLKCPWCAAHINSQPIFNTQHVVDALSRALNTYGPMHGVALTGGEPFTNSKILDIKADIEAAGLRVFVLTNGTLHDNIWDFVSGNTLDICLSVHNPSLFGDEVNAKKSELLSECRARGLKMMAAMFSVETDSEIESALDYISLNGDAFHTFSLSTIYRKGIPARDMESFMSTVFNLRPETKAHFVSPGKVVLDINGNLVTLRRAPIKEEYNETYDIPGCLFMAWDGEFYPVALAHYKNEEVLA